MSNTNGSGNAIARAPWEDRFNTPSADDLRTGLQREVRAIFDRCRQSMLDLEGVSEDCGWYGDSWKWTVTYTTSHSKDPLALVVPSPEDFQLAVPMEREFANSLPVRRMKRAIRDGLDLARDPFDTRWGVWSVPTKSLLDDIHTIIERKLTYLASK